jgi:L-asparaginase
MEHSAAPARAAEPRTLPRIAVIATGGTIAGVSSAQSDTTDYRAGALPVTQLLTAIPHLGSFAEVVTEQPFSEDSKDLTPEHWLTLARRVQARLDEAALDAIVITHGTDTLEETAFFLHLVLASDKPVVMTAAMRPATALSADGPMNLYQALLVAATPAARGRGVLVVVADRIWSARDVAKRHTQAIDALGDTDSGPLGWAHPPRFSSTPDGRLSGRVPLATLQIDDGGSLPAVEILFVAAGSSPDLLTAACDLGASGLVLALPGNGSVPHRFARAIEDCRQRGVIVVRASRTGAGPVTPLSDALAGPLLCAGQLSPAKARIALMLALAQGRLELFEEIAA